MKTDRVRARLSAYLEGDVSAREAIRIESALEANSELREELRGLQATVSLLRGLPQPEAPPALAERVVARIRAGEADPVRWRDWLHRLFEPTFAVPLTVSAVALLVVIGTPPAVLTGVGSAPGTPIAGVDSPVSAVTVAGEMGGPQTPSVRPLGGSSPRMLKSQRLQMMRRLRGAGHPHSAWLASQMEPAGDVVLASFSQGSERR